MDDLKDEKETGILVIPVHDYYDKNGDGNIYDLIGQSYAVIYPEDWKKEYEENGTTQFLVEAKGGIPGTYRVTVKDFVNWSSMSFRDMSVDYSAFGDFGLEQ